MLWGLFRKTGRSMGGSLATVGIYHTMTGQGIEASVRVWQFPNIRGHVDPKILGLLLNPKY